MEELYSSMSMSLVESHKPQTSHDNSNGNGNTARPARRTLALGKCSKYLEFEIRERRKQA